MALSTDRQKCAHLLRRFGLGASEAEIDYYLQNGLSGAVDRLLNYDQIDEGFDLDPMEFANAKGKVGMPGLIAWWTTRLIQTRRPLQEKMTLFWHNHFATAADKVTAPGMMYAQNEILRRNATGNFKTLLGEVSKDPAMIFWLDNETNIKGRPNENFAREVMELFTLGIGNYTEHDIQQGARAFTGWSIRRQRQNDGLRGAEFVFRAGAHDGDEKEFFGQRGNFDGDDILKILCGLPRTAEFITWKAWKWFAYDNPEPEVVSRVAAKFRDAGLDIKALLRAIMTDPEFYSKKSERAVFKNPCDFAVATARQLGVGELLLQQRKEAAGAKVPLGPVANVANGMANMGMRLFYPPDVAGWRGGAEWISTATMLKRISWGDVLFSTGSGAGGRMNFDAAGLFVQDSTPDGMAHKLASIFDAPLSSSQMNELATAAWKITGPKASDRNANLAAAAISRLIFASPEFQFV